MEISDDFSMNTKTLYITIGIVAVLAGGIVFFQFRGAGSDLLTNGQMLGGGRGVPIVTESDVSYYPGARGYFARPERAGSYPGVVMIHENRGVRPEIRMMADELASEGYLVLAVDLFDGRVVETQDEARAITANFNRGKGVENMHAAAAYLKEKGATRIASLGWCFGGAQSLALALSGEPLDATVIYYGVGLATTSVALAPIEWPVLGIFGDQDRAISVETVRQFEAALNTRGIENEIYIYPGVGHAFANPSGASYAPDETKDAWAKTVAFLDRHLK